MLKTKKFFKRLIAIVLCAIFLDVSSVLSVFAVPSGETIPITNEQIAEALQAAQFIDPSEDSTFVLARSDVQISDKEIQSLKEERERRLQKDRAMSLHIRTLKRSRQVLTKWDDTVWTVMVEKAIVNKDKSITFNFYNGSKVRVGA